MSTLTTRTDWVSPNLLTLLETYNISPRRSLGQAFLNDQQTILSIVGDLCSYQTEIFIEIGTGPGMLTYELAQQACTVVSIEIDKRFVPLHNDLFSDLKTPPLILYEDARDVNEKRVFDTLRCKENNQSNLNSDAECGVISRGGIPVKKIEPSSSSYDMKEEETIVHHPLRNEANVHTMPPYVLFGNLPYYLTTELILSSLTHFPRMRCALFMIQQDVTSRLIASPGSKRYGPLAIASQLFGHWEVRRTVSRQSFYPVPRVTSKLVELIPSDDSEARLLAGSPAFHTFLVALFQSRRKTIGNALSASIELTDQEARLSRALSLFIQQNNLSSSVRAESLNPSQLAELFQLLQA